MDYIALITAAGSGTRMGDTSKPKQFLKVKNKPILFYSINAFQNNPTITKIIVITNKEYMNEASQICEKYHFDKVIDVIEGGNSRQASVFNGLRALKDDLGYRKDDIVLIHDAARPLVNQQIIDDNIKACLKHDAVITVINATDTTISSFDGEIMGSLLDRNNLYQVQTPQTFRLGLIYDAHRNNIDNNSATDDGQLVEKSGHKVHLVKGNKYNFKVTTKEDLNILEGLLKLSYF